MNVIKPCATAILAGLGAVQTKDHVMRSQHDINAIAWLGNPLLQGYMQRLFIQQANS